MSQTYNKIANELMHNAESQKYKYQFCYTVSGIVPPNSVVPFMLTVEQDADFLLERITGSAYGPCTTAGIPTVSATDFPMPGIAAGAGFAGRGLSMQMTDTGSSRNLTSGYVPFENLFTPGYGANMMIPMPFKYFVTRNSKIRIDVANRDTEANANHQIDIAFIGIKYVMPDAQVLRQQMTA